MRNLPPPIDSHIPPSALAPMQDVTTQAFMKVIAYYGAPDYFFTEYFRVYSTSSLEPHILASIVENDSGRPVFAQLIGEDTHHMIRTVRELVKYPVAGIDLNMGCPAPKVYRKNVGGGLLRDPHKIDELVGALRQEIEGLFTVKMRIGFDSDVHFETILSILDRHSVDLVSIHGRTVKEMYRGEVHYGHIATACKLLECPVFANGNISSAEIARNVWETTGVDGIMIGRGAIRNPWIFGQIRNLLNRKPVKTIYLEDVREYVDRLWRATNAPDFDDQRHTAFMKKFLNFVGQGVDEEGLFLHEMRRCRSSKELFDVCDRHLIKNGLDQRVFADEPYAGVVARPNHEGSSEQSCSL